MGDIIVNFEKMVKPRIAIERRVDDIEIQKLTMWLEKDVWLATESGEIIGLHGRDNKGNLVEVDIPISVMELRDALSEYLGGGVHL